jgi:hypothetical protein
MEILGAYTRPSSTNEARESTGAGAAYGTAKAGIGIAGVGTFRPELIMKVRWSIRVDVSSVRQEKA